MKNAVKYLGLLIVVLVLIVNSFMIKKLVEQNYRIESALMNIVGRVNDISANDNSIQTYQLQKPEPKEVMTPSELAKYLGINMDKVYTMVQNKDTKIPYINIDGEYRFNRTAIEEWMKTSVEINTRQ